MKTDEIELLKGEQKALVSTLSRVDRSTPEGRAEYMATLKLLGSLNKVIDDDAQKEFDNKLSTEKLKLERKKINSNTVIEQEKIELEQQKIDLSKNQLNFDNQKLEQDSKFRQQDLEAQLKEIKSKKKIAIISIIPSVIGLGTSLLAMKIYSTKADQALAMEYIDCGKAPREYENASRKCESYINQIKR